MRRLLSLRLLRPPRSCDGHTNGVFVLVQERRDLFVRDACLGEKNLSLPCLVVLTQTGLAFVHEDGEDADECRLKRDRAFPLSSLVRSHRDSCCRELRTVARTSDVIP